ncbi:MAG: YfhO family protein [Candidatus Levyibacteriota bacterium]|jgi:hypothetical protein
MMRLIQRFWPVVLIIAVWFIFASPYFIQHKVPFSSTYLVNFFSPWNAYQGFASPVKNNAMPDVISQIYPWKTLTIEALKHLQIPLWNPYGFSGTPLLANYQSAVLSPFNLLFFILPFIDAWSLLVLLQPLLAGIFTYFFLRTLRISKEGAVISSLGFMFCGFLTTWMAYATLGYAILFLPLALFAIEKFYQTQKNRFLVLLAFSLPLSFFSGHFQISIYFFLFVIAYQLFKFWQVKNLKNALVLLFYTFVGILLSLPQLLPSVEAYTQSLRSGIFEKAEVIPWGYLLTFLAPDFLGNPVTRNDWFGHYAEWNAYVGVIPLILGCFALFRVRKKEILFFGLMALLAILFSFQTPLLDLLVVLKIPVLSTSALSRIIVLFSFSVAVLAGYGFEQLLFDIRQKNIRPIYLLLTFFVMIFAVFWGVILLKLIIPLDRIVIAKQNLILPTVLFFIFWVLVTSSLLVVHLKKGFFLKILPLALILVVAFDLLRFSGKWMPFDPRSLMYPNIPIAQELNKISGFDRVMSNIGGEGTLYYRLPSLEGYDAVYIKRYGEFIASLSNGKLAESARSVVSFPKNGLYTKQAINLLGVKYIVNKVADGHSVWNFPFWTYPAGTFLTIYNDGIYQVFENKDVFPRAFLVNQYAVVSNPQKILDTMFGLHFDLRQAVVLEQNPKLKLSGQGTAHISSYASGKISIETNSSGNNLLFLSDTDYPGWQAYVDGRPTSIYRADFAFRAIYVPSGIHQVEFIYNPLSFNLSVLATVFGLILMAVFTVILKRSPIFSPKI